MGDEKYIGKGWAFPPTFIKADYNVKMVSGLADIFESLYILFSTIQGERIMLPYYGSDIKFMVFENITNSNINLLKNKINQQILYYEPRINVIAIDIKPDDKAENILLINIDFTVSVSNERANIVFPFYINEGTLVKLNR